MWEVVCISPVSPRNSAIGRRGTLFSHSCRRRKLERHGRAHGQFHYGYVVEPLFESPPFDVPSVFPSAATFLVEHHIRRFIHSHVGERRTDRVDWMNFLTILAAIAQLRLRCMPPPPPPPIQLAIVVQTTNVISEKSNVYKFILQAAKSLYCA